ncbi:hypothetical protein Tco_0363802 [Tanacetum coccineum]
MLVQAKKNGEGLANPTDPHHTPTIIQPSTSQPQKKQKPRKPKRKDTKVPQPSGPTTNVADEAVYEEMDDSRVTGARNHGANTIAQTRFENVSKHSNDPLLAREHKDCSSSGDYKFKTESQEFREERKVKNSQAQKIIQVGICLLAWMGRSVDIEGRGLGELCTYDIMFSKKLSHIHPNVVFRCVVNLGGVKNRPPTRAQQRSIMCTYLKNMEGLKPKSLKNRPFANIQELFDKAMKMLNTFVDYRAELVEESFKKAETELLVEESSKKAEAEIAQESSSKRAREELEQESSKKQKVEEDKESEELKKYLEIVPDDGDDVTIDATPLSIKSPTIVDYKIYQEGKKSFFQIIRADVKARFKKTKPVNYMDNLLLHYLKSMFEHHVWKNQQGLVKVLNWKLYDSCGVHCVTMQSIPFYLLVEKMYPLTNHKLHQMFNDVKLQVDYDCEMAFELLRLGRFVGIKSLLEVTAAKVCVTAAKLKIMDQEEIQQAAHEEAWVPKADRVNISTTNMRIDPIMTQKEETYQVILDIIKNTTFYKAFLASADVLEIYMRQFWFIVTKIKKTNFYEFKLANTKCQFDVEVFRKALNICPRV